jgi:3-hydroxybutyryl-CoA dehydratase
VVEVTVEVTELMAGKRRAKLHCACTVDGALVLDGEALVMVPGRDTAVPV